MPNAFQFGTCLKFVFPLKWTDTRIIKYELSHKHPTSVKSVTHQQRNNTPAYTGSNSKE